MAKKKTAKRKAPKQKAGTVRIAAAAARGRVKGAVTALAKRVGRRTEIDAIEMLEQEHRQFESLLARGEETTERATKARLEILRTLSATLLEHEQKEEQVLYPVLKGHPEAREVVLEGYEEHHVADLIVAEIKNVSAGREQWGAKFKVLKETIEHHIQEEEKQMFPVARGVLSRDELLALGRRMRALKPARAARKRR